MRPREYEEVRVLEVTIGHHNETVAEPDYLDTLTCGMEWVTRKK